MNFANYCENQEQADFLALHYIATQVHILSGDTYIVGGGVRDRLTGNPQKDTDIEIHGITVEQLKGILAPLGKLTAVGESFGIYNVEGLNIDIAMPRTEKATGHGHRDFETYVDPFLGTEKAAMRRDFTINALMEDAFTGEIIDHFGGRDDLEKGIIRHVNATSFVEDPLRVLRCAQFAARFGFSVAPETLELCRHIRIDTLPKERIEGEMKKALLKAERPSIFFKTLREMDQLDYWFPEVKALIGVKQNPLHHAEGDVWTHTMMVLDQAATRRDKVSDPYAFMLSALCHDFGKPATTTSTGGSIHAYGHAEAGGIMTDRFLDRVVSKKETMQYVLNMVMLHMQPNEMAAANAKVKSTNHMFDKSVDPYGLIQLAISDSLGKQPVGKNNKDWLKARLDIYTNLMTDPYIQGRDLIEAGLKPDRSFGAKLAYAHQLHLAMVPKAQALPQVIKYKS